METPVNDDFSLHENYRDEEPAESGSDRAFGYTVGSILMAMGAIKSLMAGAVSPIGCLIFAVGAVLLLLGIIAPSRLATLNRLWLIVGDAIAKAINPIMLALVFFFVVTPMAFAMRIVGKRPLRLAPDRTAASYWIKRDAPQGGVSNMKRQF
jgi:membrane-bound ClpP family serine protease